PPDDADQRVSSHADRAQGPAVPRARDGEVLLRRRLRGPARLQAGIEFGVRAQLVRGQSPNSQLESERSQVWGQGTSAPDAASFATSFSHRSTTRSSPSRFAYSANRGVGPRQRSSSTSANSSTSVR